MSLRRARLLRAPAVRLKAASFKAISNLPTDPDTAPKPFPWSPPGLDRARPAFPCKSASLPIHRAPNASAQVQQTQQIQRTPPSSPVSYWAGAGRFGRYPRNASQTQRQITLCRSPAHPQLQPTRPSVPPTCWPKAPSTPPMSVERLLPPTLISLRANTSQPFPTTADYLPPINASGSSLVQAENNLNARISLLV
jgi:hypothetical protein